jgi:3-hydroxybutyryl-CoA dehydrogenase
VSPSSRGSQDTRDADLLIEAVVEDAAVKEDVFRAARRALAPERSSPRTRARSRSRRSPRRRAAERVIGMHFFNPVPS